MRWVHYGQIVLLKGEVVHGDAIIKAAKALGITPLEVFVRCASAHNLRQAEVVAEDRHIEWQSSGVIPDYVTRWLGKTVTVEEELIFV